PHQRGLALVRDADRGDLGAVHPRRGERPLSRVADGGPDQLGVVLDPARLRIVLRELGVASGADGTLGVDHPRGGARSPLIEREDITAGGHEASSIARRKAARLTGSSMCRARRSTSALVSEASLAAWATSTRAIGPTWVARRVAAVARIVG